MELLSATDGSGAWTLGLWMARRACGESKVLVVADRQGWFYPVAAARLGIDLHRVLVVRPASVVDLRFVVDQSLRCAAVGAVLAWHERLSMAESRRLELATQRGGGVGILLRPRGARDRPSCAPLRLLVTPVPSRTLRRCVRVEVVRCRGAVPGESLVLEIDDETGHVYAPAALAPATAPRRPARATG